MAETQLLAAEQLMDLLDVAVDQAKEAVLITSAELDPPTARLLRELDGSQTLEEALAAAVDDDHARHEGLALARRMLEIGFLELDDEAEGDR